MAEKIVVVLTFLLTVFFISSAIWFEVRVRTVENKIALERAEIEEMKKQQRITSADVDFIQMLIIEGGD